MQRPRDRSGPAAGISIPSPPTPPGYGTRSPGAPVGAERSLPEAPPWLPWLGAVLRGAREVQEFSPRVLRLACGLTAAPSPGAGGQFALVTATAGARGPSHATSLSRKRGSVISLPLTGRSPPSAPAWSVGPRRSASFLPRQGRAQLPARSPAGSTPREYSPVLNTHGLIV